MSRNIVRLWGALPLTGILLLTDIVAGNAQSGGSPQTHQSEDASLLRETGAGIAEKQRNNSDYFSVCSVTDLDRQSLYASTKAGTTVRMQWPASSLRDLRRLMENAGRLKLAIDKGDQTGFQRSLGEFKRELGRINAIHSSKQNRVLSDAYWLRYIWDLDDRQLSLLRSEYLASLANFEFASLLLAAREKGMISLRDGTIAMFASTAENAIDPACYPVRWCKAAQLHRRADPIISEVARSQSLKAIEAFCRVPILQK